MFNVYLYPGILCGTVHMGPGVFCLGIALYGYVALKLLNVRDDCDVAWLCFLLCGVCGATYLPDMYHVTQFTCVNLRLVEWNAKPYSMCLYYAFVLKWAVRFM